MSSVYAICTSSRTGSSWLCDLLYSTQCLGWPGEYLNPPLLEEFGLSEDTPFTTYLEMLRQRRGKPMLGIKGSLRQLRPALEYYGDVRCIFLRRRDRLRQAISLFRAQKTQCWGLRDGEDFSEVPPYKESQITYCLGLIHLTEQQWLTYFERRGTTPLSVWYEDVQEEPEKQVARIASFLGVELPKELKLSTSTQIQRDQVTDQWLEALCEPPARSWKELKTTRGKSVAGSE